VHVEAMQGQADLLSEQRGRRVKLIEARRGSKARLLRMAMENAAHAYQEKARAREDQAARLAGIMERLGLAGLPRRIECVDISHSSGADTVAVIAALNDGEPDRKRYRSFHVRSARARDDYAAMYEVLGRRFRRGRERSAGWELPDLLVLDGGKGQLGMALAALRELQITGVAVAALAKEKPRAGGEKLVDRVYLPGRKNPIQLRGAGDSLNLLAALRDEAHRASNALRLRLGARRELRSALDDVRGVGPKTRALLLRELGSMRAVSSASIDELVAAGANRRQAEAVYAALH
jgi:excinuclease ABC subunit C